VDWDDGRSRRKSARHTDRARAKACRNSRVGWLEVCGPGPRRPNLEFFRGRLAELGYVQGKNLLIEQRFADCSYERMPGLATELAQIPVDVLFTMGTRASRIVAETVKSTPLVVYSCDPFEHVTRLARGRGNLTGVTCMTTELSPKRLWRSFEPAMGAPGRAHVARRGRPLYTHRDRSRLSISGGA